jgi:hypothetical protein
MVVLLVALVAGAGFCPVHAHAGMEHNGGPALDLCVGMLGVALPTAPLVVLEGIGGAVVPAHPSIPFSALEVLELPPKP